MKVFLTGGTGYLGNWIARELMKRNHQVVVLARDPMRAASLLGLGAELVSGDILQASTWKPHLSRVDAVIHAAGLVKAWGPSPDLFDAVNIQGTEHLLDAAQQYALRKVIVTGSLFALGPSSPDNPKDESVLAAPPDPIYDANDYVRTKTISSRRVFERQQQGSGVMQVFPTLLTGPGVMSDGNNIAAMITKLNRGQIPGLIGDGEQVWNFVGVADAARGHVLALEHGTPGANYILGGDNRSQRQFFEFAASELGKKPPARKLGERLPLWIAQAMESLSRVTGKEPMLTRGEVRLSNKPWAFFSERARKELGYDPAPIDSVLRETIAWLREEIWPRQRES